MSDRVPCCIPFCRRTAARNKIGGATEIICGRHWRLSDKTQRRVYRRARARAMRNQTDVAFIAADRIWGRIKRVITERAMGI